MSFAEGVRAFSLASVLVAFAAAPLACVLQRWGLSDTETPAASGGAGGSPSGAGGAASGMNGAGGASHGVGSGNVGSSHGVGSSNGASSGSAGGAGGGSPGGDPCGPGSTSEIQDDFNDGVIGPLWMSYADGGILVSEAGQHVSVGLDKNAGTKKGGYLSRDSRSLLDCHLSIEVTQVVSVAASSSATVYLRLKSGSDWVEFAQRASSLGFARTIDGVAEAPLAVPYDRLGQRFWRFREVKGTLSWETSADGKSWQLQRVLTTPSYMTQAVSVEFGATGDSPSGGEARFDNVNVEQP